MGIDSLSYGLNITIINFLLHFSLLCNILCSNNAGVWDNIKYFCHSWHGVVPIMENKDFRTLLHIYTTCTIANVPLNSHSTETKPDWNVLQGFFFHHYCILKRSVKAAGRQQKPNKTTLLNSSPIRFIKPWQFSGTDFNPPYHIFLTISIHLPAHQSICLLVHISSCLHIHSTDHPSINLLSIWLIIFPSFQLIYLSDHPSIHPRSLIFLSDIHSKAHMVILLMSSPTLMSAQGSIVKALQ